MHTLLKHSDLNIKRNVYTISLTSVTKGVAAQPPELKDWARELDISGAFVTVLNVGTLFGRVAFPSKRQNSIFLPFVSWWVNSNFTPANRLQDDDHQKKDIIFSSVIQQNLRAMSIFFVIFRAYGVPIEAPCEESMTVFTLSLSLSYLPSLEELQGWPRTGNDYRSQNLFFSGASLYWPERQQPFQVRLTLTLT